MGGGEFPAAGPRVSSPARWDEEVHVRPGEDLGPVPAPAWGPAGQKNPVSNRCPSAEITHYGPASANPGSTSANASSPNHVAAGFPALPF